MARSQDDRPARIGVVGAGLMGTGVAAVFAAAAIPVVLVDAAQTQLDRAPREIERIARELVEAGLLDLTQVPTVLDHVRVAQSTEALGDCDFVQEAIPESLPLKHSLYRQLEDTLAPDAIIASNTSGLMPSRLAEVLHRPRRFLVAHFWNPPHAIPLVEVVPSSRTDEQVITRTVAFLQAIGQEPVVIHQEIPGFVGNRLQYALLREALAIVRSGAASAAEVDAVMRSSLGRRLATTGPIETADLGGLDTFLSIAEHLMPELATDQGVLDLIRAHVAAGEMGLRSGQGFYSWSPERIASVRGRRDRDLLRRRLEDRRIGKYMEQ